MKRDSDCGTIRSRHFEINLDFGEAAGVYTKGLVEKVVKSFHGKVLRDYQILKPDLRLHLILYSAEGKNHAVASYPEYRGNFWCEYTESADLADFMTIVTSFTPAKEASPQK
ncbi:MAG TPA: hypothetical protein VNB29_02660 [Chthoniobacterales bacterium]|nr:hypothetical protein [Chthoniobacterales bacterium]